jgi:hypothetical protein
MVGDTEFSNNHNMPKKSKQKKTSFPSLGPFSYHTSVLCDLLILTITLFYSVIVLMILIFSSLYSFEKN